MVSSPCINVCKMDPQSGLCLGCFRTLDEISAWASSSDETRRDILAEVARRRREQAPGEDDRRCDCDDGDR